jgi:hypothetical protein
MQANVTLAPATPVRENSMDFPFYDVVNDRKKIRHTTQEVQDMMLPMDSIDQSTTYAELCRLETFA